jgi:hypothetical protein
MIGRPCKLTKKTQDAICRALANGNTRADAATLAGVVQATLYRWLAEGRKQESGEFRDLLEAVKRAESQAVDANVKHIKRAASKQWQAAAWWLERRRPKQFGRRERLEHTGPNGAPLRIEIVEVVPPKEGGKS